jgi:hypothetical protein
MERIRDGDVYAPFVVAIVHRGERRDGVDEEKRRVSGRLDRSSIWPSIWRNL